MIVPKYWAEASLAKRIKGRKVNLRRFGWSDIDQGDAQRNAETRVQDAMEQLLAGKAIDNRERRVPYNGAQGVPIREEVVATHGETVITRNSYGALCLNTPNVLFADMDIDSEPAAFMYIAASAVFVCAAVAVAITTHSVIAGVVSLAIGLILVSAGASALKRVLSAFGGDPKNKIRGRLRTFADSHPDWHIRLYETPAGYRAMVLHRTFDPLEPEVQQFFAAIKADPLYARMCSNQCCFRARVSPKPWRIGIAQHLKPRPGTWPIKVERMQERAEWVQRYEQVAEKFASCRFIEALGKGRVDPIADAVRELHDDYARATRNLPIA